MIKFDGREYAKTKNHALKEKINDLKSNGITPTLATILPQDNEASELYVNLKKKKARELGAEVDVYEIGQKKQWSYVLALVKTLNQNEKYHGVMVQLPLPKRFGNNSEKIIKAIDPTKDVDGLLKNSPFIHPTAKAAIEIMEIGLEKTGKKTRKAVVVGATGMVGEPLVRELKKLDYDVAEVNQKTKNLGEVLGAKDVVFSATGSPGLITADHIKKDALVIDIGSPRGDVDYDSVSKKVSFITPVPGGVGPVTISCLIENLVMAASK